MSVFQEIGNRRIIPAVGVYIGGVWMVIEILDRLVERYLLSPYITDMAFWGLYSLLPAVILIAWTHGKPGKDQSTRVEKVGDFPVFEIDLKYFEGAPVISQIKRVSTPGRRVYKGADDLPHIQNGLGISIVSTPKGVMSDAKAREANVGGEVLCQVY